MANLSDHGYILDDFSTTDNPAQIVGDYELSEGTGDLTDNCIRFSNVADGQTKSFSMAAPKSGLFGIRFRVSSEKDYDFFRVYINGTKKIERSGETGFIEFWTNVSESDVIDFQYVKDASVYKGSDNAFIERLFLYPIGTYEEYDFSGGIPDGVYGAWTIGPDPESISGYSLQATESRDYKSKSTIFRRETPCFLLSEIYSSGTQYDVTTFGKNGISHGYLTTNSALDYAPLSPDDFYFYSLHCETTGVTGYVRRLLVLPDLESDGGSAGGGASNQSSQVSGVVQIDSAPAERTVRAFGYEPTTHQLDGNTVNLSKSLGQATSDPSTGEYTLDLLGGYDQQVFVVAFDNYGADFEPDLAVSVGDRIHPSTPNGYVWECVGSGTLPADEPAWIVDTETAQTYGTASMIAVKFWRAMVHGPVTPEVIQSP